MNECSIDHCSEPAHGRGMCIVHYGRWYRTGNPVPQPRKPQKRKPLAERIWSRVHKTDACWLWKGARSNVGYAQMHLNGKTAYVHRVVYEMLRGPIAEGMVLDHVCHTRHCVNPEHLQQVTNKQNVENRAGAPRHSVIGVRGVSYNKQTGKYYARATEHYKTHREGEYDTVEEAAKAAVLLRRRIFTNSDLGDDD